MKYIILIVAILFFISYKPLSLEKVEMLKPETIIVEVKGHLENPGNFEVLTYSNFKDLEKELILYEDSDLDHLSLNKELMNHDVIVINKKSEKAKISINSASLEDLMLIKGVGPTTAERIIEYREVEGGFKTLEDLMNVKGIGEKTFQKLKDSIIL